MNVAAALALQSIPFAGLLVTSEETSDLAVLFCFVAVGLVLSMIGIVDDGRSVATVLGVALGSG